MEFVTDEDLYGVLGVAPAAEDPEIRKAYKKLAASLHPDRFVDRPDAERDDAQHKFARVSYAYNVLKNPTQRNEYDFMRRMKLGEPEPLPGNDPFAPTMSVEEAAARHDSAEKKFRMGMAYQADKNFKAAFESFKEAVHIDPSVAQYHTMLALVCHRMGWVAYGLAEIQSALKIDPKDQLALKLRSQLRAEEKAQEEEEEAKANKGKKKKKPKKGVEEVDTRKAKRRVKLTGNQKTFKRKRTSLFQSLLDLLLRRK